MMERGAGYLTSPQALHVTTAVGPWGVEWLAGYEGHESSDLSKDRLHVATGREIKGVAVTLGY